MYTFSLDVKSTTEGTVYLMNNGSILYKHGVLDETGLAYATFQDNLLVNGWGVLDVVSGYEKGGHTDPQIMYAAGFLEGALTYRYIYSCCVVICKYICQSSID